MRLCVCAFGAKQDVRRNLVMSLLQLHVTDIIDTPTRRQAGRLCPHVAAHDTFSQDSQRLACLCVCVDKDN